MPFIEYHQKKFYYDVQGEGHPLLILNGIMMSTKSWDPFVPSLSQHNQLIRVDFFDQGQSDKLEENYTQSIQVEVLEHLLHHLGIKKVSIVGISYGGEIAILYASKNIESVERLVLFNTTSYTSPWLLEIGKQWKSIGKTRDGQTYYQATIPVIYSPTFYEMKLDWMKKREAYLLPIFSNPIFLDAMDRLITSAESYDARDKLNLITCPTLIVSGDEDYLTPIENQKDLKNNLPNAHMVILPKVGHASMYEKPLLFVSLILGFINTKDDHYIL